MARNNFKLDPSQNSWECFFVGIDKLIKVGESRLYGQSCLFLYYLRRYNVLRLHCGDASRSSQKFTTVLELLQIVLNLYLTK